MDRIIPSVKLKALPRSRAKTAWGLLQDVKRAILAEPKRANMWTFRSTRLPEDGGPACGTVGCLAGWVNILSGDKYARQYHPRQAAEQILGSTCNYLFGDAYHVFNAGSGDACETTKPGTRAHAQAVVNRINRFMRVNKAKLKAKSVSD